MLMRDIAIKLICITSFILAAISVQAQQDRVTINVKEVEFGEVLRMISEQTGLEFSYNPRRINIRQKVTLSANNKSLKEILDELASKTETRYVLLEDQIVLQPVKEDKEVTRATISGFVKDATSGEPLIGATVVLKELGIGTASNAFGFYSITAPPGTYQLECTYIGYKDFAAPADLSSDQTLEFRLTEQPPVLPELTVYDVSTAVLTSLRPGETNVRPRLVADRPAYFGEVDVIKSLESIPGVKMHSDGSTFYYVRGGNRDQNLVLIDDAPIYNPSHLLGLFSTIIPDAVNDLNFYSGDTPASIGGRISSVLDVRTKKGNDQQFEAWGSLGLISTKAGIEGPFKKDRSSYLLSTRFSRLKWLTRLANSNVTEFQFYDVTGKVNFSLNQKNRLFFSFYSGNDGYFNPSIGIRWANKTGTIKWSSVLNDRLFLNMTLLGSSYDYFLYTDVTNDTRWSSHIGSGGLKADFTYFLKPGSEVNYGMSVTGFNFNPGNASSKGRPVTDRISSNRNSSEFVLYASHDTELGDHWKLDYGLRLSSWVNTGDSFEFVYNSNRAIVDTLFFSTGDRYARFLNLEPRVSVRYSIGERSSVKASFARNVQNVHMISNSISPFSSMEVWLPSSININPQQSNQATLGYYRSFPKVGVTAVAEVFHKTMANLIDFVPHAETLLNPAIEGQLLFGKGRAYGFELQLKKAEGRLRGIAGYSYARSRRTFDAIDNGRTFNAFSDRPHQINLTSTYELSPRWEVAMNWNYSTGAPFSSPTGFYAFNGSVIPIFGAKNNDRLPDYHRMDVAATWKLNRNPERRYHHSLTFAIYNFYGRKNPLFVNYNKVVASDGSLKVPGNLLDADPVISSYYLSRFTPSLTYTFRWH